MSRVLVIDDEDSIRKTLRSILERQGYDVVDAATVSEALSFLKREPPPDAALVDLKLPDGEGTDVLERIVHMGLPSAVVMISGHASIRLAVDAVRNGAFDFIEKPMDRERLLITLRNAVRQSELMKQSGPEHPPEFPTVSERINTLLEEAKRFAISTGPVLIMGETGTGKEVLARWVHGKSPRASRPFVALNCAALPESLAESELFGHVKGAFTGAATARKGKFLTADGGSLFLDEIGDLSLSAQAKLLRVLEEGRVEAVGSDRSVPISVRVLAATHRDLDEMADDGAFRKDLLFRISGLPLRLPPLRERPEDIAFLAQRFLDEARTRQGWSIQPLSKEVLNELLKYSWPGNVRELRWSIERAALLAGPAPPERHHLLLKKKEADEPVAGSIENARRKAEVRSIESALEETGGNVSSAARRLGISRSRLYEKLSEMGLDPASYRPSRRK